MGADGHGHGHGHGHHPPYEIPDYRIYKLEDAPELLEVQKALAAKGLRDPWMRNEVWRYDRTQFGASRQQRLIQVVGRGFKFGFAAFVLTVIGTAIYDRQFPDQHGHGGHGGHGEDH